MSPFLVVQILEMLVDFILFLLFGALVMTILECLGRLFTVYVPNSVRYGSSKCSACL